MIGFGRSPALAAVALVLLAIAVPPAAAAPRVDGTFDLSGTPKYLTRGPDGNIWVALSGSSLGNDVARVTPDGVVTEFDAVPMSNPVGITTGPDGNLWVTQSTGVAKFPPADPLSAEAFAVNLIVAPESITEGPDGNLWTASGDQLIKIPPADPTTFTGFTIAGMGARGIAAGGNGELWIADFGGNRIVSATTSGDPTFYDAGGGPQDVGAGMGEQILYADPGATPQEIGRINPGGTAKRTGVPNTDPFGIALGSDGAYWIAQFATSTLGRLTADGDYTTLEGLPAASGPRYLTAGPGKTLWVGLESSEKVARITGLKGAPNTTITERPDNPVEAGGDAIYKFKSKPKGAKFQCRLVRASGPDRRARRAARFRDCDSPKRYRDLKPGHYEFAVRAVRKGLKDPTPATDRFRVVR